MLISSNPLTTLRQENVELNHKVSRLEVELEEAHQKIQWFEEQLKLGRQRQFGKSSEKLSAQQEELIFNVDETLPTSHPLELPTTETITYTRSQSKGRKIDTALLPRYQVIHDLENHEKQCTGCGKELHKIREDISEQLEMIKLTYVLEHVHPQYGCRQCETVTSAKKAPSPIPKSIAGASLLMEVILGKYEYHLPLYRQSKLFKSTGLDLADNTLGNWVMQAGEGLRVLDDALCTELMSASYLQVDETPVKVLDPEKKGYMWCYLNPLPEQKLIRFRFDLTRGGHVAETDLKDFKGLLQTDGYGGYNGLREKPGVTALGCITHSRRKFVEVEKIGSSKSTGKAQEALKYFAELYRIEEEARGKLNFEERKLLRQKESIPLLEKFHEWLIHSKNQVPPQSAIGQAIDYTLRQWIYLKEYVNYGEVEIDTNWVENQIRPFALGRRNWLFVAHEESAQIAALFYSLIQSAKLNNLNPRVYLHYLLTQVHALRKGEVKARELLPHCINRELLQQFANAEFEKAKLVLASLKIQ